MTFPVVDASSLELATKGAPRRNDSVRQQIVDLPINMAFVIPASGTSPQRVRLNIGRCLASLRRDGYQLRTAILKDSSGLAVIKLANPTRTEAG